MTEALKLELKEAKNRIKQLESLLDRVHRATLPFYNPKKKSVPNCPYDDIYRLYTKILVSKGFPDIRELTDERKSKIRKLWQKHLPSLDDWENYFTDASTKPFLFGKNDRHWCADFDFIIREGTPIKAQEGKYD